MNTGSLGMKLQYSDIILSAFVHLYFSKCTLTQVYTLTSLQTNPPEAAYHVSISIQKSFCKFKILSKIVYYCFINF